MFASIHAFHICHEDENLTLARSLNDLLDDLAESFARHIHDGEGCLVPRLKGCATG